MGQVLSQVDNCFQPEHLKKQSDSSSIPQPTKQASTAKAAEVKVPAAPVTEKTAAPKKFEPTAAPTTSSEASPAAAASSSDTLPPYTNRPEDLSGYPKASGSYQARPYEAGVVPDCSSLPALTGEFVTDGKVSFDKAALAIPGVYPTRDEEVAAQQKALDLKKDAAAATETANKLHQEANSLFESGDKDGNKTKMAESKEYRTKAQDIHQSSFDIAYGCAMSQAFKALYSKSPSVDYHVFLVDPYEKSCPVVLQMMKKFHRFGRKDFMVIPGEGQHSGPAGAKIPPHWAQYMKDHSIVNEPITSGSYAIQLSSIKG